METIKVFVDGEEIELVTKIDEDDVESNDITDSNFDNTLDLTKELKELEKTIEFQKGDFDER